MKHSQKNLVPKVRDWLEAIGDRTGAFVVDTPGESRDVTGPWDEVLTIRPHGSSLPLRVVVESRVRLHPQNALAVAARIRLEPRPRGPQTVAVVAARYISDRVAAICREGGIGYVDDAGNCHLEAPGLYLHIEGQRNPTPDTRPAENLFAPKSSRIVRALLEYPARTWKVQDLAREARVSIGLASRLKHKLITEAFVETSPQGIRLRQPQQLLDSWVNAYANAARAVPAYSMDEPRTLERRVAEWCRQHGTRYALAEFSAAARWSPMVRYTRPAIYLEEPRSGDVLRPLMRDLDLKEVDSGPSAVLWVTDDEAIFFNSAERDGVTVASPLQTYLDLVKNPARGQEAASELLQNQLLPRFAEAGVRSP